MFVSTYVSFKNQRFVRRRGEPGGGEAGFIRRVPANRVASESRGSQGKVSDCSDKRKSESRNRRPKHRHRSRREKPTDRLNRLERE